MAKVQQIDASYRSQQQTVQALTTQHQTLTAQLQQEQTAAAQQANAVDMLAADDSMQAYFNKHTAAIEKDFAKIEARQNKAYGSMDESATQHAERIVAETQKAVAAQEKAATAAQKRAALLRPDRNLAMHRSKHRAITPDILWKVCEILRITSVMM